MEVVYICSEGHKTILEVKTENIEEFNNYKVIICQHPHLGETCNKDSRFNSWLGKDKIKVVRSIEMDYFCNNFDQIIEKYRGKWICINGKEVVSFGDTVKEAHDKCKELGIKRPLITKATKEGWEK